MAVKRWKPPPPERGARYPVAMPPVASSATSSKRSSRLPSPSIATSLLRGVSPSGASFLSVYCAPELFAPGARAQNVPTRPACPGPSTGMTRNPACGGSAGRGSGGEPGLDHCVKKIPMTAVTRPTPPVTAMSTLVRSWEPRPSWYCLQLVPWPTQSALTALGPGLFSVSMPDQMVTPAPTAVSPAPTANTSGPNGRVEGGVVGPPATASGFFGGGGGGGGGRSWLPPAVASTVTFVLRSAVQPTSSSWWPGSTKKRKSVAFSAT